MQRQLQLLQIIVSYNHAARGWKVVSWSEGRESGERVWVVAAKVTVKGGAEGGEREREHSQG
jgi:hypothetical protein